jgi:cell division topological specificity factor
MSLFDRLFGRRQEKPSGQVARERLRLVLAHDRANIPPKLLETLKDEIVAVISRHVAIDADDVRVTFSQGTRESRLVADIPLLPRGTRSRM